MFVPLGAVTIYSLYAIHLWIYTIRSLTIFFLVIIYIYTSCAGVILPLHLYYICACIVIFLHNITVSTLTCLCMLYNIIIGCTSPWGFDSKFLLCMGYSDTALFFTSMFVLICLWMLYLFLMRCVGVLQKIYYLVVLNFEDLVMDISCIWFVMTFLPSSLTCINKNGLTSLCLN